MPAPRDLERDTVQVEIQVRRAGVSEARRLKSLEDENRRLKKLPAESMLDEAALKDLLGKTFEACGAKTGGEQGDGAPRAESATRLPIGKHRSFFSYRPVRLRAHLNLLCACPGAMPSDRATSCTPVRDGSIRGSGDCLTTS
jgi:hypothetical protein